jgi:hypothetical protein
MLGKPKSNDKYIKTMKRKLLILECFQLIIGVIGLALFKRDILKGWAVLGFCTVLLIGALFTKPVVRSVE